MDLFYILFKPRGSGEEWDFVTPSGARAYNDKSKASIFAEDKVELMLAEFRKENPGFHFTPQRFFHLEK